MRFIEDVCGLALVMISTYVLANGILMFLEYIGLL
jgi:hypothetical protein